MRLRDSFRDLRMVASMRPPEFTGGNEMIDMDDKATASQASMRPPEFTGGNPPRLALTQFGANPGLQ